MKPDCGTERPPAWLRWTCFVLSTGIPTTTGAGLLLMGVLEGDPFTLILFGMCIFACLAGLAFLWGYSASFADDGTAANMIALTTGAMALFPFLIAYGDLAHDGKGIWSMFEATAGSTFAYFCLTTCLLHLRLAYLCSVAGRFVDDETKPSKQIG